MKYCCKKIQFLNIESIVECWNFLFSIFPFTRIITTNIHMSSCCYDETSRQYVCLNLQRYSTLTRAELDTSETAFPFYITFYILLLARLPSEVHSPLLNNIIDPRDISGEKFLSPCLAGSMEEPRKQGRSVMCVRRRDVKISGGIKSAEPKAGWRFSRKSLSPRANTAFMYNTHSVLQGGRKPARQNPTRGISYRLSGTEWIQRAQAREKCRSYPVNFVKAELDDKKKKRKKGKKKEWANSLKIGWRKHARLRK